jgi:hypothetical protein
MGTLTEKEKILAVERSLPYPSDDNSWGFFRQSEDRLPVFAANLYGKIYRTRCYAEAAGLVMFGMGKVAQASLTQQWKRTMDVKHLSHCPNGKLLGRIIIVMDEYITLNMDTVDVHGDDLKFHEPLKQVISILHKLGRQFNLGSTRLDSIGACKHCDTTTVLANLNESTCFHCWSKSRDQKKLRKKRFAEDNSYKVLYIYELAGNIKFGKTRHHPEKCIIGLCNKYKTEIKLSGWVLSANPTKLEANICRKLHKYKIKNGWYDVEEKTAVDMMRAMAHDSWAACAG